ncbi:MAG TPA: GNAT family N-acetyltransferase [Acidobacteriaceae bacterium]
MRPRPASRLRGRLVCCTGPSRAGEGGALMHAAEEWARTHGCREMASDALIDNEPSELAHRALGFEVVDRCIHLRKSL